MLLHLNRRRQLRAALITPGRWHFPHCPVLLAHGLQEGCLPLLLFCVCLQEGLAHLCLVGSSTTLVRAKIEANLPRKRGPAIAGYDKAWDKFMDQVCAWVGNT
jgi:hypothetical protein